MSAGATVRHVTCLGCGCACDDIEVRVRDGRIESIEPSCPVSRAWFGDGRVPDRVLVEGRAVSIKKAVSAAAELLAGHAGRVLVYVGPDLSSEAQRRAIAVADLLGAAVDGPTSGPAAAGLLAAQRRGRAAATLGEIRARADVVLFWGVDPSERYPRYLERFAPARPDRVLLSVSVGADRGPRDAEPALELAPEQEVAALSVMRATVLGNRLDGLEGPLGAAAALAERLMAARYAAVVHEAEPGPEERDPHRAEGLIALVQALNGPTRAALSSLRAGGNRSGLESVMTWQTGYPMAVEYAAGFPSYRPGMRGLARLGAGEVAAALVVGSAAGAAELDALGRLPTVVIGPRASEAPFGPRVAIDTGVAGIHEAGTGYRMDEVPLPLAAPLSGARGARETLDQLLDALRPRPKGRRR